MTTLLHFYELIPLVEVVKVIGLLTLDPSSFSATLPGLRLLPAMMNEACWDGDMSCFLAGT